MQPISWRPRRWFAGLLIPLALWLLAMAVSAPTLESALSDNAAAALRAAGFGWVAPARVAGRDLALAGQAPSEAALQGAPTVAAAVPGVRRVDASALVLMPETKPYPWSATRAGAKVTLEGAVPSLEARAALAAAAKKLLPGVTVEDRTALGRGAPDGFAAGAREALAKLAMLSEGRVSLTDNVMAVEGRALDFAGYDALQAPEKTPLPGFTAGKLSILPPKVAPFLWTATLRNGTLMLGGFMPTEGALAALATDAARIATGVNVRNLMQPAGGEVEGLDYGAVTRYALRVLALLDAGEARLSDRRLTISGASADSGRAAAVRTLLSAPPDGITSDFSGLSLTEEPPAPPVAAPPAAPDASASAAPPPPAPPPGYRWGATLNSGALTLSGAYPDEKSHREILDLARQRLQGVPVKDEMRAEIDAPRRFVDGVTRAFDALARLATGSVRIAGTTITVQGEALLPSGARHIKAALADALPPDWTGEATVAPQPAPAPVTSAACQKLLREVTQDGRISFENGEAAIKPEAAGLLDRVAVAIRRCPDATVEVDGYTDTAGSDSFNQDLSERRATAVVEYLVKEGEIPAARLKPVGFGASKPVASNDTEEGKVRNRRIEFVVR